MSNFNIRKILKFIAVILVIFIHYYVVFGALLEELIFSGEPIYGVLASVVFFAPTLIAMIKKMPNLPRILLLNILLAIVADFIVLTANNSAESKNESKPEYVCESCNKTFGVPEKMNKFLRVCGLLGVYGVLLWLIESIPTNDISLLLPRFILDIAFVIIAIVHILITLFKDNGRGKCPYCGAADFISINSVKGQELMKQIEKLHNKKDK